jgi:serralysin
MAVPVTRNEARWCFAWLAEPPASHSKDRLGLLKSAKWQPGEVIRISFLDGTETQKQLVKKLAVAWIDNLANLHFSWVNDTAASDIRITFRYPGSWSVVGNSCRMIPKDQATMNFGWLTPDLAEEDARGVILHEFGHALGLIHEHQRLDPAGWARQTVLDDLSRAPNRWDTETIEQNVFETQPPNSVDGSELDTTSIMMYEIPASWRTDGYSAGENKDLSPIDRAFIRKLYP